MVLFLKLAFTVALGHVAVPHVPGPTLTISVIGLGGDPTGNLDASPAFDAALAAAAAVQNATADDWTLGSHRVLIDLGGGAFNISRSISFFGRPSSGVTLGGGALVAGAGFPSGSFAIEIGGWAEGVHLEELTIDMQRRGGGVRVNAAESTVVRGVKVVHYSTWGLLGDDAAGKSNELFVLDSEFAEYMWSEKGFNDTAAQTGTGVEMRFYDSHFYNTIIRCTRVGVVDSAGSNLYHGVHIYSTCNKDPGGANVAVGMLLSGEGTRVHACNFDDSPLVVTALVDQLIQGNIFYGLANLTLAPDARSAPLSRAIVTGNAFRGTPYAPAPAAHFDARASGALPPAALRGLNVADNSFSNASVARATRVALALRVTLPAAPARPCPLAAPVLVDAAARLLFAPPPPAPPVTQWAAVAGSLALLGAPPGEAGAWAVVGEAGGVLSVSAWRMGGEGACEEVEGILSLTLDQQLAA
jgi:hypothetical protein